MTNKIDASSVAIGIAANGKPQPAFFALQKEPKIEDKRTLLQGLAQLEMNFSYYLQLQAKLAQIQEAEKAYQAAKHNAAQLVASAEGLPEGQVKATLAGFQGKIAEYESRQQESLESVTQQAMGVYEMVLETAAQIQRSRANLIADWNFADPYDSTKALAKPGDDPAALDHITERQQEFINQHINEVLRNGEKDQS